MYEVVLGDLGPDLTMQLLYQDVPFVLNAGTDSLVLRYITPDDEVIEVDLDIVNATTGEVKHTVEAGDFPVVGAYRGQVKLERSGDLTFPRSFPNNGSKIIWWVHETI